MPTTKIAKPAESAPGDGVQIKRGRGRPPSGKQPLTSAEKMRLARERLVASLRHRNERFALCVQELRDVAGTIQDVGLAERIRSACAEMGYTYDLALRDLRRTNGLPWIGREPSPE